MRLLSFLLMAISLTACERTFRDMYDQPRYKPLAPSSLWSDGRSSRPTVEGTQPYSAGTFAGTSSGRRGIMAGNAVDATGTEGKVSAVCKEFAPASQPGTEVQLARGRNRYDIFCAPCHSVVGDGDGMIARRGFPTPPSFHDARRLAMTDPYIYDVITAGQGAMASYADSLEPADRCAIVAYIRALQLSQRATVAAVPPGQRAWLNQEVSNGMPSGGRP